MNATRTTGQPTASVPRSASPAPRPRSADSGHSRSGSSTTPSSALLGRVDGVGSEPRDGLPAGATGAGPDAEQGLEFAEYGVESQAGAGAFGSLRSSVQNA